MPTRQRIHIYKKPITLFGRSAVGSHRTRHYHNYISQNFQLQFENSRRTHMPTRRALIQLHITRILTAECERFNVIFGVRDAAERTVGDKGHKDMTTMLSDTLHESRSHSVNGLVAGQTNGRERIADETRKTKRSPRTNRAHLKPICLV